MAEKLDGWMDDDFGQEFIKFQVADKLESELYDNEVSVIYIKPDYNSIKSYVNQWNKNRKKIQVDTIRRCINTPYDSDEIIDGNNVFLDMGARLFNTIKSHATTGTDYLKVLKISNPNDKFDVQYYASTYKLVVQKKVATKSKKK